MTDFLVCGCFLKFGMLAPRKTFGYNLQISARMIVQNDFSIPENCHKPSCVLSVMGEFIYYLTIKNSQSNSLFAHREY